MEIDELLRDGRDLPTVRIKQVTMSDFKSVEHGDIVFNCAKTFIPYGTESDILGLYGQNGSGKTALIEALSILRSLMCGDRVGDEYVDCVSVTTGVSTLKFYFDFQYADGEVREVIYSFDLKRAEMTPEDISVRKKMFPDNYLDYIDPQYKLCICNEVLQLSWKDEEGNQKKTQTIIDTSTENMPFGPTPKRRMFVTGKKDLLALEILKSKAYDQSQSFIFKTDTLAIFKDAGAYQIFYDVLTDLSYFANFFFFVIDTKSTGFIRMNLLLPVYTRARPFLFNARKADKMPMRIYLQAKKQIEGISEVLCQLVPGLTIELVKSGEEAMNGGEMGAVVSLVAHRDGIELPLRDESDGVRKIISVLSLIAFAFSCQSATVAIDEFDAGIYEYLLGEILEIFEQSGKGQFIFTSHNLRPLEVLSKKFIYFTTTNPKNRYIRLKGVGNSNNLRDVYFREIHVNEQDERIYNNTKRHKIISAFIKAGSIDEE